MIWPFLFGSWPSIIALYCIYRMWPWWSSQSWGERQAEIWLPVFLGVLITGLSTLGTAALGCWLADCIGSRCSQIWKICWRAKLATLRSSDGTEGKIRGGIFLVSGYMQSRQVYYYYTTAGDSSYKPHKWFPDEWTTIYEEDRQDGEVQQFDCHFKRGDWLFWFATPADDYRMDFHIPRGSIQQQFKLE